MLFVLQKDMSILKIFHMEKSLLFSHGNDSKDSAIWDNINSWNQISLITSLTWNLSFIFLSHLFLQCQIYIAHREIDYLIMTKELILIIIRKGSAKFSFEKHI